MKGELVMIGAGGHCLACIDVAEQAGMSIAGVLEPMPLAERVLGKYDCLGDDRQIPELAKKGARFLVSLGQIKSSQARQRIFRQVCLSKGDLPVVVSPHAHVSPWAKIGKGTIVMHGAIINAGSVIGDNCIINTRAVVEHGVRVGSHCHISTGAVVNGDVHVGKGSFVGSCAMVSNGVSIGTNCIVGAGVNLFSDLDPDTKVRGIGHGPY